MQRPVRQWEMLRDDALTRQFAPMVDGRHSRPERHLVRLRPPVLNNYPWAAITARPRTHPHPAGRS